MPAEKNKMLSWTVNIIISDSIWFVCYDHIFLPIKVKQLIYLFYTLTWSESISQLCFLANILDMDTDTAKATTAMVNAFGSNDVTETLSIGGGFASGNLLKYKREIC